MNEPLYTFWWSWVLSASGQLLLFVPLSPPKRNWKRPASDN